MLSRQPKAILAQSVERIHGTAEVNSSILLDGSSRTTFFQSHFNIQIDRVSQSQNTNCFTNKQPLIGVDKPTDIIL